MPLISPFCRLHVRAADVQRLCFVPSSLADPVRRAAYYNADPQNLVRHIDKRAQNSLSFEEILPLLVRDRTPGFYLCESNGPAGSFLGLAVRLGNAETADEPQNLNLPFLRCETNEQAQQLAARLASVSPAAASFLDGDTRYTVKPVHDPLAIAALQDALAEISMEESQDTLPPDGSIVCLLLHMDEKMPADFPAGLFVN